MALRTWAIWARNIWIGVFMAGIMCTLVIVATVVQVIYLKSTVCTFASNQNCHGIVIVLADTVNRNLETSRYRFPHIRVISKLIFQS